MLIQSLSKQNNCQFLKYLYLWPVAAAPARAADTAVADAADAAAAAPAADILLTLPNHRGHSMGLQFQQSPTKLDAWGRFHQEITKMHNKTPKRKLALSCLQETKTKRGVEKRIHPVRFCLTVLSSPRSLSIEW